MKCPSCQSENSDEARFCQECGSRIGTRPEILEMPTLAMTREADEFAPGTLFAGRYRIIEDLGKGGMGRVFKALDTEINEKVALKLILPEISADEKIIARFQDEVRFARRVSHKNICRTYHLGREKDSYYIVMEYVQGQSLKSMIQMTRPLSLQTAVHIAREVCEGLAEAHRLGIIHRDLKPQNIMVDEGGNIRIMDFGLARSLATPKGTLVGAVLGTPSYMSPEQAEGQEADHRSDIYSLGIILYEMATGRVPFESDSLLGLLAKQKSEVPPEPRAVNPEIPEVLNRVILKCLEKERDRRYQSAGDLLRDLGEIQTTILETNVPPMREKSAAALKLRKRAVLVFGFAAVLAAGFLAWRYFSRRPPSVPSQRLSIAVIHFTNQTGDPSYDYLQDAIPNLLITSLEASQRFRVTTWERLYDLLKKQGKTAVRFIDSDMGLDLCQTDGIEAIVLGSFVKAGDTFVTDVKVLDVKSKQLLKSASSRGNGVESILKSQIDELSEEITRGIALEERIAAVKASPIREVTTSSMEAYQAFLKGREAFENWYFADAKRLFERAIELDPEFAMAYVYLAQAAGSLNDLAGMDNALEKSKKFGGRLGGKEKLYADALAAQVARDREGYARILLRIAAEYPKEKRAYYKLAEYYSALGKYDESNAELQKVLDLDPKFGPAMNWMAYNYSDKKDFEKALSYFREYASVSPGDANPYDSMGELYVKMGNLDRAIEEYRKAITIKPDFGAQIRMAYCYAMKENYPEALKWIDHFIPVAPSDGVRAMGHEFNGLYRALQGEIDQALDEFGRARAFFENIRNFPYMGAMLRRQVWISYDWGKNDLGRKYVQAFVEHQTRYKLQPESSIRALQSCYLGLLGLKENRLDSAQASLAQVKAFFENPFDPKEAAALRETFSFFSAEMLLAQGLADRAISEFQKTPLAPPSLSTPVTIITRNLPYREDLAARAFEKKGETDKAIAEYERLLEAGNAGRGLIHPFSRFRLAKLYEKTGRQAQAIEQYEKVLEIWKDADKGLPQVEEARTRLAALRAK